MSENGDATREERLAAKLRENLRRRKAQARAMEPRATGEPDAAGESGASADASTDASTDGGLSKERPSG